MSSTTLTPVAAGQIAAVWGPRLLSIVRIVAALMFMGHGIQKLFGFPAPPPFGMPAAFTLIWFAGVIELVGGALVLVGFLTRPVAFLMSGEMALAYFMVHARQSPFPVINGGDSAVLYCFLFLYLAAVGGGAWSVDRAVRRA